MKIGIMGGTFDPVHNGHLMLGKTAYKQFQLDEVWFMPNGRPPHKEQRSIQSDAATRTEMVSLAIEGVPGFRLEEYEVTKDGTCFSYETMEHFSFCRPEDSFYFIIGADSLFSIETWAYPGRLLSTCTVLAATAPKRALLHLKRMHRHIMKNPSIMLKSRFAGAGSQRP